MRVPSVKRLAPIAAAIAGVGGIAAMRSATLQPSRDASAQAAAQPRIVRTLPPGTRVAGDPGKRGDTYYWIEAQTVRSTIRAGGDTVVADRRGDGKLHAKVTDVAGNDRGDLTASSTVVQYRSAAGDHVEAQNLLAQNDSGDRPTLHWAATQALGLSKDGAANLVWDGGVMRPRRAGKRDLDKEADEVETVWANGVVARLTKHDFPPHEIAPGRVVQGRAWVTDLTADGVAAGHSIWFERDQVFAYSLPGLTQGLVWIGPEHLRAQYGGWPFKPDVAWLNLQTIASHHFGSLMAKQGFVARNCEPPKPNRLAQFFFPTLSANEPGCDGLHWLDGSMIRQCCDDHDRCYSRNGCTISSWWQFWKSWSCDFCNMAVVSCFAVGSDMDPCRSRSWWGC